MDSIRKIFTERVQEFLTQTDMPGYKMGLLATGNSKFWSDFQRGKHYHLETLERVESFIETELAALVRYRAFLEARAAEEALEAEEESEDDEDAAEELLEHEELAA